LFNRSAVVGFYWDEFLFPYDPAGVKRRGEGERESSGFGSSELLRQMYVLALRSSDECRNEEGPVPPKGSLRESPVFGTGNPLAIEGSFFVSKKYSSNKAFILFPIPRPPKACYAEVASATKAVLKRRLDKNPVNNNLQGYYIGVNLVEIVLNSMPI